VIEPVLQVVVAPGLVGAATLAARRWGERAGGLVSAFPAIVGPVLLIAALDHGPAFAARVASGTLLGLAALAAFVLVYGRAAGRLGWLGSLAAGWAAAAVTGSALGLAADRAGPATGLAVAVVSLSLAGLALPRGAAPRARTRTPRWDLPLRMALTALLVVGLGAAGGRLGPQAGGILAALPVLASVLAVFTHEQQGPAAVAHLLRGMLAGMAGFVAFCALVAALASGAGVALTFTLAALASVAAQAAAAVAMPSRSE
jgi:hypothetical protein